MKVHFKIEEEIFPSGEKISNPIAIFESHEGDYVDVYAQIGQHSTASREYIDSLRDATKEEYKPLYDELLGIGYEVEII